MTFECWQHNNGHSHFLDRFDTREEAEEYQKTMTNPDWDCWIGIDIYEQP